MSFNEYLRELSDKVKIFLIIFILLLIPGLALMLDGYANYKNPAFKPFASIFGWLAIPAIILALVVAGYYKWKYKQSQ